MKINEYTYGNTNLNISSTGGADIKGPKGIIKTLPGLAVTSIISWPLTVFMAIGILNARLRQRIDKRHSWLQQIFNPNYWGEYYANIHKGTNKALDGDTPQTKKSEVTEKEIQTTEKELEKYGYYYDASEGVIKDSTTKKPVSEEELMSKISGVETRYWWIRMSNGEIMRLRSDSEKSVRTCMDKIIDDTKSTYDQMQDRRNSGMNVYDIELDDGERIIWVAPDKKTAEKEGVKQRIKVAEETNKGLIDISKPGNPAIPSVKSVKLRNTTKIEYPEKGKYEISTSRFDNGTGKSLSSLHMYEFNRLHEYTMSMSCGKVVFPAANDQQAESIVKEFFDSKMGFVKTMMPENVSAPNKYTAHFVDGDSYVIGADTAQDAGKALGRLRKIKEKCLADNLSGKEFDVYKEIIENHPDYNKLTKQIADAKNMKDVKAPDTVSLYKWNPDRMKSEKMVTVKL